MTCRKSRKQATRAKTKHLPKWRLRLSSLKILRLKIWFIRFTSSQRRCRKRDNFKKKMYLRRSSNSGKMWSAPKRATAWSTSRTTRPNAQAHQSACKGARHESWSPKTPTNKRHSHKSRAAWKQTDQAQKARMAQFKKLCWINFKKLDSRWRSAPWSKTKPKAKSNPVKPPNSSQLTTNHNLRPASASMEWVRTNLLLRRKSMESEKSENY